MKAPFEDVAQSYDADFTNTLTGRYQREQVWSYLDKQISMGEPKHILEVNCGTGEDAIHMAKMGHDVFATDLSHEMIRVANSKITEEIKGHLRFKQMNMLDINSLEHKFDLIFSDFGGLNCLSPTELGEFLAMIPHVLKPKGRFIAVVMPKFCLIESLYFIVKLDLNQAFRRKRENHLNAQLLEKSLTIWYYTPKQIRSKLKKEAILIKQKGIGLFIPPSYLDRKFSNFRKTMRILDKFDGILSKFSMSANLSDHFLIDIEMKK